MLGLLETSETEQIDLRLIEDEEFAARLRLAESELVEDHLDGGLSESQERLFREVYMVTDARKQFVRETMLLKEYAQKAVGPPRTTPETKTGRSSWLGFISSAFLRPATAAAVVLLLAGGVVIWQVASRGLSPLERQYAEINGRDMGDLAEFQSYSSVSLVPGSFRDQERTRPISLSGSPESVFFRLAVPTGGAAEYEAELQQGGRHVMSLGKVRVYENGAGKDARLFIPASALTPGQYDIRLTDPRGASGPLTYLLSTE